MAYLSVVNMSPLTFFEPGCRSGSFGQFSRVVIVTMIPLLLLFVLNIADVLLKLSLVGRRPEKRMRWRNHVFTAAVVLMFFVLPSVSAHWYRRPRCPSASAPPPQHSHTSSARDHLLSQALVCGRLWLQVSHEIVRSLVCDEFDDGSSFVSADYRVSCSSRQYRAMVAYCVIMALLMPIGVPAFLLGSLWPHRAAVYARNRGRVLQVQEAADGRCCFIVVVQPCELSPSDRARLEDDIRVSVRALAASPTRGMCRRRPHVSRRCSRCPCCSRAVMRVYTAAAPEAAGSGGGGGGVKSSRVHPELPTFTSESRHALSAHREHESQEVWREAGVPLCVPSDRSGSSRSSVGDGESGGDGDAADEPDDDIGVSMEHIALMREKYSDLLAVPTAEDVERYHFVVPVRHGGEPAAMVTLANEWHARHYRAAWDIKQRSRRTDIVHLEPLVTAFLPKYWYFEVMEMTKKVSRVSPRSSLAPCTVPVCAASASRARFCVRTRVHRVPTRSRRAVGPLLTLLLVVVLVLAPR
jgi:hypothetical protein